MKESVPGKKFSLRSSRNKNWNSKITICVVLIKLFFGNSSAWLGATSDGLHHVAVHLVGNLSSGRGLLAIGQDSAVMSSGV